MDDDRLVRPRLEPSFGFSDSIMANVAEAVNKIKSALQENQQKGYTSVTDTAFTARLEKAMQKNFDYIRRKDQGLLVSGPKNGTLNSRSSSSAYSSKAPTRLGIGSAVAPPPPPTSAAHSASTAAAVASKNANANAQGVIESTSVYVSKLPTDISEEELEILFGALGRIKKVRIYTTALGTQKGDALITFALAETAMTACFKFNNLDIGDGHVISVVRAEFNANTNGNKVSAGKATGATTGTPIETNLLLDEVDQPMLGGALASSSRASNGPGSVGNSEQGFHSHFVHSTSTYNDIGSRTEPSSSAGTATDQTTALISQGTKAMTVPTDPSSSILYTLLPAETEVGNYPVVLIMNAFDPANAHEDDPSFFDELETDMLLECCDFGKVRTIQLLTLPPHYLAAVAAASAITSNNNDKNSGGSISMQGVLGGAIGVTFELTEGAQGCAAGLRDRRFDGRVLKTFVLAPRSAVDAPAPTQVKNNAITLSVESATDTSNMPSSTNIPPPPPPPPRPRPPSIPRPISTGVVLSTITSTLQVTPAVSDVLVEKQETLEPNIEAISNDVDDFLTSLL